MSNARTFAMSLIVVSGLMASTAGPAPSVEPTESVAPAAARSTAPVVDVALPPTLELAGARIYAESDDQVEVAVWALGRFADAHLDLPNVELHMHDDWSKCGGSQGRHWMGYFTVTDGKSVIHSCGAGWITLHELGHAWDRHNLVDADREALLERFDLEAWVADEWKESGRELVASIIAWALDESTFRPPWFAVNSDEALGMGFLLATGMQPPDLLRCGLRVTEAGLEPLSGDESATPTCGTRIAGTVAKYA